MLSKEANGIICNMVFQIRSTFQPRIEPASPALERGFLTTGPPGSSLLYFLMVPESYFTLNYTGKEIHKREAMFYGYVF